MDFIFLKKLLIHALISLVFFAVTYYASFIKTAFSPRRSSNFRRERCDFSDGEWAPDGFAPYYTEECPFLDPGFRCRFNGRNDTRFLQWRWRPRRCLLPRFNASLMLEMSRDMRILFVGDSIGRNQWESLVCMLWVAIGNKSRVYERDGNPISKHKGYLTIFFEDYNLTVEYYRAPFLVAVSHPPERSPAIVRKSIHIDIPQWECRKWVGASLIIFNSGHWWSYDKTLKSGNYFQIGNTLNMTITLEEAYIRAIQTIKQWAHEKLHPEKSSVFFRSYSQSHYSNGSWDTGGNCDEEMLPEVGGAAPRRREPWSNRAISEVLERTSGGDYMNTEFLNITFLTEQRPDGHPSKHKEPGADPSGPQDCSHWCLPGVPDAWNEILFARLVSQRFFPYLSI